MFGHLSKARSVPSLDNTHELSGLCEDPNEELGMVCRH